MDGGREAAWSPSSRLRAAGSVALYALGLLAAGIVVGIGVAWGAVVARDRSDQPTFEQWGANPDFLVPGGWVDPQTELSVWSGDTSPFSTWICMNVRRAAREGEGQPRRHTPRRHRCSDTSRRGRRF